MALALHDPDLFREQLWIDGQWQEVSSDDRIGVDDPATGDIIGYVPNAGAEETKKAIAAAEQALPNWRQSLARERAACLTAWFELISKHRDDLARIMTAEQGKPLAEAKGEISYASSFVRWYAEEALRVYGETIPAPFANRKIIVEKQPIGVCAAITPWNFPAAMITRKIAPALAAGCTVVVKPSELTPFTALALGVLAERAGCPPGTINIVVGDPEPIGTAMTESPVVRKLSFTGSTRVGKWLMERSAATVKKLSLELGGNAPFLVFDDADVDEAVAGVLASKFRNGGQTCVSANRIYVQSGVYDSFAEALRARVAAMKVGAGNSEGVEIGPMINEAAVAKINAHVVDATEKGAKPLAGGEPHSLGGRFFQPTVLKNCTDDMRLVQEETFGPVAPLFCFETEEEAIAAANSTPFGLAAYLYTKDLGRSFRVGDALEAGMVSINAGGFATEVAPFGGVKESGLGREGARQGLEEYLEVKTYHIGGL